MVLIAENFNSSITQIAQALESKDCDTIRQLAEKLDKSRADYIDVNAGVFHDTEADKLLFLIAQIRQVSQKPLVIDSPDPRTVARAACFADSLSPVKPHDQPHKPHLLLNSITLAARRYQPMLETALRYKAGLIALLMDENGMTASPEKRLRLADTLITRLTNAGIPEHHLFIDPMITPVATDDQAGQKALRMLSSLRQAFPNCHLAAGLSNISYGLPARRWLNRAFLLQAMAAGLDSPILNPLDDDLMHLYAAGLVLLGKDEWCMDYLNRHR